MNHIRNKRRGEISIQKAQVGMVPCPHCGIPFMDSLMPKHIEANHREEEEPMISIKIEGHGTFSAPAHLVDRAISEYLPASPAQLRQLVTERAGVELHTTTTVSEALIILASFYADNPF